jgi:hypothetical protein
VAEEKQSVQNWGVLIAAAVLGLIAVGIHNWQINQIRQENKGKMAHLYKFRSYMKPGDRLDPGKDLEDVEFPRAIRDNGNLGDLVVHDNYADIEKDYGPGDVLTKSVSKDEYLRTSHTDKSVGESPSRQLEKPEYGRGINVNPNGSLGEMLREGDRVNLMAVFTIKGQYKTYRVIEDVRVLSIGGKTNSGKVGSSGYVETDPRMSNYRTIGVALSREASEQLEVVANYVPGKAFDLELVSPKEVPGGLAGKVNPELWELLKTIPPPPPSGSSGG